MTPDRTSNRPSAGRHGAVARSRTSIVLAVVIPLLTVGALTATSGEPAPLPGPVPPKDTALTSLQLVCPPPIKAGAVSVSSARASGEAQLRSGEERSTATVVENETTVVDLNSSVVVDGRGPLAPGLVAAQIGETGAAATACSAPQPDYWFTGAGSASIHSSELELVNPDAGGAIADIEIFGDSGLLPVDAVRGVTVPGGTATTIDLAETAPDRSELTVHVTVARGRLGASMVNRIADDRSYADWLAPQAEPASSTVLLGLAEGRGERQLVVANPSDDQARVQIKVIGSDSTFAALGLDELSIPPQSVSVTDVSDVVGDAVAKEESGLLVTSTVPVTSGLRSVVGSPDEDLSQAVAVTPVHEAALLLPEGKATLVLAAPTESDSVTVTSYAADGELLGTERVAVKRLTSAALDLPEKTSLVDVRAEGTPLPGAVRVVTDRGVSTLPLQELVLTGLVPAVSPGWVHSAP